ncbi:MAG: mevalonate kinase [Thermoplasmata archaeon]|nr:mevalonate kinase [Thermoplasmata archaeon]
MTTGKGYGKVIMFNEHFVVYGIPAIAGAIDRSTVATVEPCKAGCGKPFVPGLHLVDDRPATEGYKEDKIDQQRESVRLILEMMAIDPTKAPIRVHLGGDLKCASGIGASAASCTAMARALDRYYKLGLSDVEINRIAFEGEKGYHGTPSGLDNTVSTFGGLIWYVKGEPMTMEPFKVPKPVEIVMGNTGKVADTTAAVAGVRERRQADPERYGRIFVKAGTLVERARGSLEANDMGAIGKLMDENHRLLQEIEVSSPELDLLVDVARENGAIGAKMTGGGLGGNIVALTPGKRLQEKVARAIEEAGFEALRTRIG